MRNYLKSWKHNIGNGLIPILFVLFILGACKKNDLDLDDPTIYQWEITETWSSTMPHDDNGTIKVDMGKNRLVVNVENKWLTNAQVQKLKDEDKRNSSYELKFRKLK
ncbi:hypothetical protein [Sphingobacterium sp. 1.A.4]|uniref:hypothetical protein n=1 Tax=Sphingobacterium sp. 1.A.4 TaxID=2044603 RepID=UPI000C0C07B6|nr:hypothetical protein [Sphingobacterium sp. 1.A.4]